MGEDPALEELPETTVTTTATSTTTMLDPTTVVHFDMKVDDNPLRMGADDQKDFNSPSPSTNTTHGLIANPRYSSPIGVLTFGHSLARYPVLLWGSCVFIPLLYLALMFGAIPIGERKDDDGDPKEHTKRFYHYWVFTCVVNPINMTIIAFLLCGTFLSSMGVARPFRVHWSILLSVFVVEVVVFNLIIPFTGTFNFFGVASVLLSYASTLIAIYVYESWKVKRRCGNPSDLCKELLIVRRYFWTFFKVAVAFVIFFLILLLYMWAFQHVSSTFGQKLLPFGMTVGVFIVRKVMLALTDDFPLSTAMLVSGFWVENIYDMFQTMAYRNVKTPVNYVSIWFTNALSLLANLVFLTDTWFEFRIWMKAYLPLMFKCHCQPWRLGIEPDYTEDENERGHSNNKPGYHRRQARFFMYKVFSKCIAAMFYLLISTILRYGVNKALFPFGSDSHNEFFNSLQFSCYNLIFLVLSGVSASVYVRVRYRQLYDHFSGKVYEMFTSRYMLGSVVALLIHNGIIAISMMMYFNMIYYVVKDDD